MQRRPTRAIAYAAMALVLCGTHVLSQRPPGALLQRAIDEEQRGSPLAYLGPEDRILFGYLESSGGAIRKDRVSLRFPAERGDFYKRYALGADGRPDKESPELLYRNEVLVTDYDGNEVMWPVTMVLTSNMVAEHILKPLQADGEPRFDVLDGLLQEDIRAELAAERATGRRIILATSDQPPFPKLSDYRREEVGDARISALISVSNVRPVVGEPIEVTVELTSAKRLLGWSLSLPDAFVQPRPSGSAQFRFEARRDRPVVAERRTYQTSALQVGAYSIGPESINGRGATVTADPVRIVVSRDGGAPSAARVTWERRATR